MRGRPGRRTPKRPKKKPKKQRGGELLVVSVVTVPRQTPFSHADRQAQRRRPLLTQALEKAGEAGVRAHGVVRIGHRADEAILHTVRQHESDGVLIGWQGRRSPEERSGPVLGPTLDRVVDEAPCEVFVEKISRARKEAPDTILLPVGGGPHGELAARTAADLVASSGATVRLVRVVASGASESEREAAEERLRETADDVRGDVRDAGGEGLSVETTLLESDDVASALLREAAGHGLILIGAAREGLRRRLLFGDLAEEVGERLPQAVLMVKTRQPAHSRLKQSLRRFFR